MQTSVLKSSVSYVAALAMVAVATLTAVIVDAAAHVPPKGIARLGAALDHVQRDVRANQSDAGEEVRLNRALEHARSDVAHRGEYVVLVLIG